MTTTDLSFLSLISDSVLGICVCVALSDGLVKKWTPTKSVSGKGTSTISTSAKKSGRQTTKKGRDPAGGEQLQLHVDPEGVPELKEALEVKAISQKHLFTLVYIYYMFCPLCYMYLKLVLHIIEPVNLFVHYGIGCAICNIISPTDNAL